MWVLEARESAEIIWYPVVWEEEKENSSNIVNYQINEEKTTENSALLNSNNNTTTWLATLIPWVNAPMLIETTSIYQNAEEIVWWATISWILSWHIPWENTWTLRNWSIWSTYGSIKFENRTWQWLWNWLVIPASWWYELYITYPLGSSVASVDMDICITKWWYWNDVVVDSYIWPYSNVQNTKRFKYYFEKWDAIYASIKINYSWSWEYWWNKYFTIAITKL